MKTRQWLLRHAVFWFLYFAVNLFNELYLSASFNAEPSSALFFSSVLSQLLILLVKIPAVYHVLYVLLPRWSKTTRRPLLLAECACVLLLFLLTYRAVIQWIVWPFIYGEQQTLSPLQFVARCFYSLLDLLQVIGIAATIKLFRQRLGTVQRERDLVQQKLSSEIIHLKSQINPHFLFNTLNSIYTLTLQGAPEAPDTVMQLSKILRYMLYETRKATIALGDELRIIEEYIKLQQTRFGGKAITQLDTSIDELSAPITPLLLLPLVENAFKHGTGGTSNEIPITISIQLEQRQLKVQLQNPVVTPSTLTGEGIGLSSIRRQLELLYRDYHFTFEQQGSLFVVHLNLNLDSYASIELPDRGR